MHAIGSAWRAPWLLNGVFLGWRGAPRTFNYMTRFAGGTGSLQKVGVFAAKQGVFPVNYAVAGKPDVWLRA